MGRWRWSRLFRLHVSERLLILMDIEALMSSADMGLINSLSHN